MTIDRYCVEKAINRGDNSQQTSIIHELSESFIHQSHNPEEGRVDAVDGGIEVEDQQQQFSPPTQVENVRETNRC